jgi:hypothetical protein
VDLHGAVEGVEVLALCGADLDDAGVVDEDVDAAEVVEDFVDEAVALVGVGEVGVDQVEVRVLVEEGLLGGGELEAVARGEYEAHGAAGEA